MLKEKQQLNDRSLLRGREKNYNRQNFQLLMLSSNVSFGLRFSSISDVNRFSNYYGLISSTAGHAGNHDSDGNEKIMKKSNMFLAYVAAGPRIRKYTEGLGRLRRRQHVL